MLLNNLVRKNSFKLLDKIRGRIDVIHSHGTDLSSFHEKKPSLTTIHGMFVLTQMKYFESRKHLNWVTVSKNQQGGFPDLNYVGVVYNGLDPSSYQFNEKPGDYVCFIGRFDREKNPLDAIKLALKLGLKIKVAGKLDFQGNYCFKKEIKPYFDDPKVTYLGEIGDKKKVELLKNARANLHPINFREPFGLTVIEAAYCGTPTLAVRRGSMPELIEVGRTGILVEDVIEAYFKLNDCFLMDRKYISERARLLFNYKKMASDYLEVFEKVISEFKKNRKDESIHTNGKIKGNNTSIVSLFWEHAF